MADPDWLGKPPEEPYWADDGSAVYFERKREGSGERSTISTASPSEIGRRAVRSVPPNAAGRTPRAANRQPDRKVEAWRAGISSSRIWRPGRPPGHPHGGRRERSPFHGRRPARPVSPRRRSSVYDLDSGLISQPAELRLDKDPADEEREAATSRSSRLRLFDVIRERKRRSASARRSGARRADPTRAPLPWYLGDKVAVERPSLSPWRLAARRHPPKLDEGEQDVMMPISSQRAATSRPKRCAPRSEPINR